MIKTPVTVGSVGTSSFHTHSQYPLLMSDFKPLTPEQCNEAEKRINMHDELVKSLQDMVEIVGGNFCQNMEIKRKYKDARELLEKCK